MGPYCQHCRDSADSYEDGECLGHTPECSGRPDGRGVIDAILESVMRPAEYSPTALNFYQTSIFPGL